jgi:hypothetical protein
VKEPRTHLTYANVVATLALIVALGGGTTAIALRGKNSVRSNDIKNGNVTGVDLSSTRLIDKPFTSADAAVDNDWTGASTTVHCPRRFRLIGGGGSAFAGTGGRGAVRSSQPNADGGWTVDVQQDSGQPGTAHAFALCLKKRPGKPRLMP